MAKGRPLIRNVIYLDNHLLVLAKPAGMLAQADETGDDDLLSAGKRFIKKEFNKPGSVFLGLVHRLDRPVSGLMVLARTSKAAARLSKQFREHKVDKRYLAIVAGIPPDGAVWHDYLVKQDRISRVVSANHAGAKPAQLTFERLACRQNFSLVSIQLTSGRAHQIRLQFASRGHAVLGDFRYGSKALFDGRNLALHAYHLGLNHPIGGRSILWEKPPPPTWRGHFATIISELNLKEPPAVGSW